MTTVFLKYHSSWSEGDSETAKQEDMEPLTEQQNDWYSLSTRDSVSLCLYKNKYNMLDSLFLLHKSRKIFISECEQSTALTCLYPIFKRSHIMLIFGFIFLITTRKCLHNLMYKNKQKNTAVSLFRLSMNATFTWQSLKGPPPENPTLLWLVSSHRPEQGTESLWHHNITEVLVACLTAQFLNTGCEHFSLNWVF